MAGRKPKLTKELIVTAEKLIKAGNYDVVVCEFLGVSRSAWYRWLQEGEEASSGIKRELVDTVKRARATAEIGAVNGILKAGNEGNWSALGWYLERKYPDRWGRKDRIVNEIQGKDGDTIQIRVTVEDEED